MLELKAALFPLVNESGGAVDPGPVLVRKTCATLIYKFELFVRDYGNYGFVTEFQQLLNLA